MIQVGGCHKKHPFCRVGKSGLKTMGFTAHNQAQPFLVHLITNINSLIGTPLTDSPCLGFFKAFTVVFLDQEEKFVFLRGFIILTPAFMKISHTHRIIAAGGRTVLVHGTAIGRNKGTGFLVFSQLDLYTRHVCPFK